MNYKIRRGSTKSANGTRYPSHCLTVPPTMADQVPKDTVFAPEWHEDGILYRAVRPVTADAPAWTKEKE